MIDAAVVSQQAKQFDIRNGDDAIHIDGWLLFSNGAIREVNPMGAMENPPSNPFERNRRRLRYCELRLSRLSTEFNDTKRRWLSEAKMHLTTAKYTPPPPCELNAAVAKLKQLQEEVKHWRQRLEEVRKDLQASKPERQRLREEANARNADLNQQFITAISDIDI